MRVTSRLFLLVPFYLCVQYMYAQTEAAAPTQASNKPPDGPVSYKKLPFPLRYVAQEAGARFFDSGLERTVLVGTIARTPAQPVSIQIVREISGKIRIEESARPAFGAADSKLWGSGQSPASPEADLIETLLGDSLDGFLAGQNAGLATRFLGSRFRMDDGKSRSYNGPYYDIYRVTDRVPGERGPIARDKRYYINSDTLLLDKVVYTSPRNGVPIKIEVLLDEWRKTPNEAMPMRIRRYENDALAFTLIFTSASVSPKVSDGVLERP